MSANSEADSNLRLFEERAENLTPEQFEAWRAPTPHETQVLRQLTNFGPKLLSGPRGCGKTTFLLTAARRISEQGEAIGLYVNYGKSMYIEPAFSVRADADGFFQDWLSAKILTAMRAPEDLQPVLAIHRTVGPNRTSGRIY